MDITMPIPGMHPGGVLENPLASQFGQLSLQDRAFLDAFNRQEQQELHGVPRPGPVDPTSLLGQIEQVSMSGGRVNGLAFNKQYEGPTASTLSMVHKGHCNAFSRYCPPIFLQ